MMVPNGSGNSFQPDGWDNDDLMRGLMSTFKRRAVNPDDFDSKMKFWSQATEDSCFFLNDPVVSIKILSRRFRRKDRIPAGLETVINEMMRKGDLERTEEFLEGSQGWVSWGLGVVARPVSWILGYNNTPEISDTEFVFPAVIKDQASRVLQMYESCRDNDENEAVTNGVVEFPVLRRMMKDVCATDRALELVLLQLQRDQMISIGTSRSGEKIVKFRESRGSEPAKLTESDTNIHNLQKTMENLQREMVKLDETAQLLDKDARLHIRQGNKMKAKQILRKKLLVLKKVKEKDAAYSNMLSLMHKLAQTKEQRQILDAYKYGVRAFRENLDQHGLSPDKVDETMDDIHEALEDHQDIMSAMAQGPSHSLRGNDTDEDLENELEDLLHEEERLPVPSKKLRLPDVPETIHHEDPLTPKTPDRLKRLRLQLQS